MGTWICVDKYGQELLFNKMPVRLEFSLSFSPSINYSVETWYVDSVDGKFGKHEAGEVSYLPKGSIIKLIGRNLTYKDDPVELTT